MTVIRILLQNVLYLSYQGWLLKFSKIWRLKYTPIFSLFFNNILRKISSELWICLCLNYHYFYKNFILSLKSWPKINFISNSKSWSKANMKLVLIIENQIIKSDTHSGEMIQYASKSKYIFNSTLLRTFLLVNRD